MVDQKQDLSRWLETATKGLPVKASEIVRTEIEAHYADAVEAYLAQGETPTQAHLAAMADLGDVQATGRALRDTHLAERRYVRAAIVSMLWPLYYPFLFLILVPMLHLPFVLESLLNYLGTLFITLYGLYTLKFLLARGFNCDDLNQPVLMVTWGLGLYIGPQLVSELLFGYPPAFPSIFVQDITPLETVLGTILLSGGFVTGLGMLLMARGLLKVTDPMYSLRLPLSFALFICSFGLISFCTAVVCSLSAENIIYFLTYGLFMSASYIVFTLLALLFFRAAWRRSERPARLT